jgi:ribosomal protein L22
MVIKYIFAGRGSVVRQLPPSARGRFAVPSYRTGTLSEIATTTCK